MINTDKTKTRLIWLDVLKGILIIFVILSHSNPPQQYRDFFTPFFLTMFFWASGYTFSLKKNFLGFLKNKVKRLLVPFVLLGLARVAMAYVIEGGNLAQRLKGLLLQVSCKYDEMWFVACMFTATIMFYLICRVSRKGDGKWQDIVLLAVSTICLIIGMLDMCIWKIRCPWQIEIAGMMVFYMAIGCLHRKYENKLEKYLENRILAGSLSVIYIALVFALPNAVDIHSERFENPLLFLLASVVVILPIILIAKFLTETKMAGVMTFFGQNTLFYYAFGGSVRVILYKLLSLDGSENAYVLSVICTIVTMLVLIIPAKVVKRYFPWAVGG